MKRIILLILILFIAAAALAQEKQLTEREKTAAKLKSSKVGLIMIYAQLDIVLKQISLCTKVEVSLDKKVDEELRVSFEARNSTAGELLRMVLEPQKLDYAIRDNGSVFVSEKEEIAKLKKENEKKPGADLKEGELIFLLKDGSRVKGKSAIENWKLKTAYGKLTIPTDEISKITFAQKEEKKEGKEGKGEDKEEKKRDEKDSAAKKETLEWDKVETVRFTVTGKLHVGKLEVQTGKGKLTVAGSDISEIIFPRVVLDRWLALKPNGKWVDTGIKVRKGDRLEIRAGAGFIIEKTSFSPDGQVEPRPGKPPTYKKGCPLIVRIGGKGWESETGKSYKAKADREGNVFLKIHIPSGVGKDAKKAVGSYSVNVRVKK